MTKAELTQYLDKIPNDEPLFLIRGQDSLSEMTVNYWATRTRFHGVREKKIRGAQHVAFAMRRWPEKKVAD